MARLTAFQKFKLERLQRKIDRLKNHQLKVGDRCLLFEMGEDGFCINYIGGKKEICSCYSYCKMFMTQN